MLWLAPSLHPQSETVLGCFVKFSNTQWVVKKAECSLVSLEMPTILKYLLPNKRFGQHGWGLLRKMYCSKSKCPLLTGRLLCVWQMLKYFSLLLYIS